jgi:DNA-binding CsgD family transcriptional regulator
VCLLLPVGLLMKSRRACSGETEQRQESSGKERTVGLLLVLLVALMTCVFSTLDNAVTLVHSSRETDIGQWPRALLALSGLAAGFVFDWKSRQYMGPIMYCVMMLSTICIAVLKLAGPFLVGLMVFYLSAGFFVVFFTSGFMELARRMRVPGLWAGMGRAVNNLTAAVIAGPVLALLSSEGSLGVIVLALLLFAVISVAAMGYTMQRRALLEQPSAAPAAAVDEVEKLRRLAETYALTERETQVFGCLVQTEDNLQTIAETMYVSRRTLERYVSAIYEKTGVKSRVGLLNLYNK